MNVIDCHCHIYPAKIAERAVQGVSDFYGIEMRTTQGTAESLLALCDGSLVSRFIVHSVATRADQVESINNFIAEECAAHPEFTGFMTLHQDFPNPETEIERACSLGLRGIKLHPDTQRVRMDDPRLMSIYEIAEGRLPVIIHTGDYRFDYSHPRHLISILRTFPNLVVDAAHFGGWSLFDVALDLLEHENCYVDMSSSMEFIGIRHTVELCRAYGCERVMFGSDFPMWNPVTELERFVSAGFTTAELELMCRENALRFLANSKPPGLAGAAITTAATK